MLCSLPPAPRPQSRERAYIHEKSFTVAFCEIFRITSQCYSLRDKIVQNGFGIDRDCMKCPARDLFVLRCSAAFLSEFLCVLA